MWKALGALSAVLLTCVAFYVGFSVAGGHAVQVSIVTTLATR